MSLPKLLLRAEGAMVLIASVLAYRALHASWVWFAVLFLTPDLGMLGYLAGVKAGSACYNALHTYLLPLGMGALCFATHQLAPMPWLLIWIAHIGFDRMADYGLKYATAFKDTHLGRV
jgi:hypothetical protein